jgi:hypothetical protein
VGQFSLISVERQSARDPACPERTNGFGRETAFLIVLPGGRSQHTIGYLSCFRKRYFMIQFALGFTVGLGEAFGLP